MSDTKTQACQWKYCESECSWDTQCDNKYQFMNDGPRENDYKFCPGCGKPVTLAGDEQPASVEPEELKVLESETGSAALAMPCSAIWRDIGDNGVEAKHDAGDETGAIVTTARVIQGGNKLWTPSVYQFAKGRPKKTGFGRIAGKTVSHYYPGQTKTREEAMRLCENKWRELQSRNADLSVSGDKTQ